MDVVIFNLLYLPEVVNRSVNLLHFLSLQLDLSPRVSQLVQFNVLLLLVFENFGQFVVTFSKGLIFRLQPVRFVSSHFCLLQQLGIVVSKQR